MVDTLDPLVLDLVEWIAREPRPYAEVIETWRTSCPRLTIWEDAVDRGYVARQPVAGAGVRVADHRGRRKIPARTRPRRLIAFPEPPSNLTSGRPRTFPRRRRERLSWQANSPGALRRYILREIAHVFAVPGRRDR